VTITYRRGKQLIVEYLRYSRVKNVSTLETRSVYIERGLTNSNQSVHYCFQPL